MAKPINTQTPTKIKILMENIITDNSEVIKNIDKMLKENLPPAMRKQLEKKKEILLNNKTINK
jgi:hypothetical protein